VTQTWIARAFAAEDEPFVRSFRCATTRLAWEAEVESWVQGESVCWVTDPTHAAMDRRLLVMLDPRGTLAGVVAHELKDAMQPVTGGVVPRAHRDWPRRQYYVTGQIHPSQRQSQRCPDVNSAR
jgi:hypothetical protein